MVQTVIYVAGSQVAAQLSLPSAAILAVLQPLQIVCWVSRVKVGLILSTHFGSYAKPSMRSTRMSMAPA